MVERIRADWNQQRRGGRADVIVKFTIQRDGTLTDVEVEQPSGTPTLDLARAARRRDTRQLPPLPDAFPNPTLTVHLNFQYQR